MIVEMNVMTTTSMAVIGNANTELIVPKIAAKDNAMVVGAWRYTSDR